MTTQTNSGRTRVLPNLIGILALSFPVFAACGEKIDQTLDMPADGLVAVENVAGTVEFATWDRAAVQIRGETGSSVEDVEINATSRGVEVRVINRKGDRRVDGTDLYFLIPVNAVVEAETVSADINLEGSRGESVVLHTVSGDLEVAAQPQRVDLHSVSGDIEFEGSVTRSSFDGASGEISANTVSGDVTLEAGDVSQGRFEAVSGDLILALALADGGRLTSDSMSGDIKLSLPSSQKAEFLAQSFSGSLHTDFGNSIRVSKGPGVMLEHREGENGAKIRLESFSGDISIRSR